MICEKDIKNMIIIYEIPVIGILFLIMGVLGLDLFPLLRSIVYIVGSICIIFGTIFALGGDGKDEKIKGVITIIVNVILILIFIALDSKGTSFSLFDMIFG